MDGLLSLLLFAGLFYVLMRFTCGSHMVHGGHGGHGGQDQGGEKHRDPVCGMEVEMRTGYGKMHKGKLYRFCSRSCLDKFETEPAKYLSPPDANRGNA